MIALLCLLTLAPPQQSAWTSLPLPSLCSARSSAPLEIDRFDGRHLELEEAVPDRSRRGSADTVLPIPQLVQMLQLEARQAGLELELYRGAPPLLASGDAGSIETVRSWLEALEARAAELMLELQVTLSAGDEANTWSWTRRVLSGQALELGQKTSTSFVSTWDAEVSNDSGVADPSVGTAFSGRVLHLTVTRIDAGRRVHVSGVLDLSQLDEIKELDPETSDFGLIQSPVVSCLQVVFHGVVSSGEALEVTIAGAPLEQKDWSLSITPTSRPDAAPSGPWSMFDLAFLSSEVRALANSGPGAGLEPRFVPEHLSAALEVMTPMAVAAAVENQLSERSRTPISSAGNLLFVPGPDSELARASRNLIETAERSRSATSRVELRHGELFVSLPITTGRVARVRAGVERTGLVDYNAEIAPETWMPQPEVKTIFDGLSIELLADDAGVSSTGWVAGSETTREIGREQALLGLLQLPTRRLVQGSTRLGEGDAPTRTCDDGQGDFVELALSSRRP